MTGRAMPGKARRRVGIGRQDLGGRTKGTTGLMRGGGKMGPGKKTGMAGIGRAAMKKGQSGAAAMLAAQRKMKGPMMGSRTKAPVQSPLQLAIQKKRDVMAAKK